MKKKSVLIAAVLVTLTSLTFGQKAFQKSSNDINAGIGFGGLVWKGVSYNVSYERGFSDRFSAGAHVGYSQYTKGSYTYNAVLMGLKGSYHFLTSSKVDPYTGAELGYISITHTGYNETASAHSYTPVGIGLYGGVRYFLSPSMGVYGELHVSTFSILGAGVSLKL